jgi:hypothetical protein
MPGCGPAKIDTPTATRGEVGQQLNGRSNGLTRHPVGECHCALADAGTVVKEIRTPTTVPDLVEVSV